MRIQQIKRSGGRSAVAAAAYRSGERLHDDRQNITHDYRRRTGVEHCEILVPGDAPNWAQGIDRETLWNKAEAAEKRKDAQTAREVRIMIPRELDPPERIRVVRDFVQRSFVDKGMIADICYHNKVASDGKDQPHAHVMLTMRFLTQEGFGIKSRHEWVPDPEGRTHPDGRPVMVESNPESWNSASYYERCREDWENTANAALERAGSAERIDRRSLLERGLSRLPEPALRLAWYMKELYGGMRERFGQFQMARHYRAVEDRAKAAFSKIDQSPMTPNAAQEAKATAERFFGWFDRQMERLSPPPTEHVRAQQADSRSRTQSSPHNDLER